MALRNRPRQLVVDRAVGAGFKVAGIAHDALQIQEAKGQRDQEDHGGKNAIVGDERPQARQHAGRAIPNSGEPDPIATTSPAASANMASMGSVRSNNNASVPAPITTGIAIAASGRRRLPHDVD